MVRTSLLKRQAKVYLKIAQARVRSMVSEIERLLIG
jgi:hypothetical protein